MHQQTNILNLSFMKTIEQKETELMSINFFVGGLSDEGIAYYYDKMKNEGKL